MWAHYPALTFLSLQCGKNVNDRYKFLLPPNILKMRIHAHKPFHIWTSTSVCETGLACPLLRGGQEWKMLRIKSKSSLQVDLTAVYSIIFFDGNSKSFRFSRAWISCENNYLLIWYPDARAEMRTPHISLIFRYFAAPCNRVLHKYTVGILSVYGYLA